MKIAGHFQMGAARSTRKSVNRWAGEHITAFASPGDPFFKFYGRPGIDSLTTVHVHIHIYTTAPSTVIHKQQSPAKTETELLWMIDPQFECVPRVFKGCPFGSTSIIRVET